jgi:hypothetical protein
MVTINIRHYHYGSEKLVKHGLTKNGRPHYFCNDCQRSRQQHRQPKGNTEKPRAEISRADEDLSSLGGLTCTFMEAHHTNSGKLPKKKPRTGSCARLCLSLPQQSNLTSKGIFSWYV